MNGRLPFQGNSRISKKQDRSLPWHGFVRPTRSFVGLLCALAAIWYAASSQSNAASYLLFFALTAVFLVSIPHTLVNLSGLRATTEAAKPTFAGQEVCLPVAIINESRIKRRGIVMRIPQVTTVSERVDELPASNTARLTLRFPAQRRGEHQVEQVRLTSAYPLGFVCAGRSLPVAQHFLVYPKPAGNPSLPRGQAHSAKQSQNEIGEGDDFAGVRSYVPGESQRHIDWKAVARGQAMMTKQFAIEAGGAFYLDYATVPFGDVEERLSQLTLWVIEAERARQPYGLRLPALDVRPGLGDAHFHRCLRELALFK